MSHLIGSVETGKLANLVLWRPAFFGDKPELVLKGRFIAWSQMGNPNASIPTPQPVHYRPMFRSHGRALHTLLAHLRLGRGARRGPCAQAQSSAASLVAVENTRGKLRKSSMIHNGATPKIEIDPETYDVTADGELLTCEPAESLPMAQRYFLF